MIRFYLFILLASFYAEASETINHKCFVNDFVKSIPFADKQEIKQLFKSLFFEQSLAYTLFGDKPMSFSDCLAFKQTPNESIKMLSLDGYCGAILDSYCEPSDTLEKKWNIWKKYESKLKFNKYYFFRKKLGNQTRIFIINKDAFLKIVNQNIEIFRKIISSDLTAEKLSEEINCSEKSIFNILKDHEGLLGILLGFGTHNAMLFQKREELTNLLENPIINHKPIQDRIELLNKHLCTLDGYKEIFVYSGNRVGFAADPNHPETIELKKKYNELSIKVDEIYSNDSWFEKTLLQLTE